MSKSAFRETGESWDGQRLCPIPALEYLKSFKDEMLVKLRVDIEESRRHAKDDWRYATARFEIDEILEGRKRLVVQ